MQDYSGLLLLIPEKADAERSVVAAAWRARGGEVMALGRFWEPPDVDRSAVRVYGNDTFCLVLAQKLGLRLVSPENDLVTRVPAPLLRREVAIGVLADVLRSAFPIFVKPVVPKQFAARVYGTREQLQSEVAGLPPETPVIRSEVVRIEAEARAFVVDRRPIASSVYEGTTEIPHAFFFDLARQLPVPDTCVLDAGLIEGRGWAFLEANASWGAGLNGCEAASVLPAIERACRRAA